MALSNLQLSLAVAGGLVLAAVVAHGAWTSRKNRPRQAEPQPTAPDSGGLGTDGGAASGGMIEPSLDGHFGVGVYAVPPVAKLPPLDALVDVIAPVSLDAPVSGDAILAALPTTRRVGSKPFSVEALRVDNGEWEPATAGQRYGALQVGVQLANRMGALKDIEYSEFVVKAQAFADALNAAIEFPEMRHEILRAMTSGTVARCRAIARPATETAPCRSHSLSAAIDIARCRRPGSRQRCRAWRGCS